MLKSMQYPGQLHLFGSGPITEGEPALDNPGIFHGRNFRIEQRYLLKHLSQYNPYLKKDWMKNLENDNLLLRTMFAGIQNSKDAPPEIFEGLNALEICLMDAGIFKRKYLYFEDMVIMSGRGIHQQLLNVRINPVSHSKESRIKTEGHLDDSLYEIVTYLLTASDVERIYNKYKKDWQTIFQSQSPEEKQKRFKKLNPYDPSTLKQKMDYIERKYPDAFWKFKKVLAEPFIPERIVRMDQYGSTTEVIHPEGFVTPGKTYRRGIRGRSFWNLREYANQIHSYFQMKERHMQKQK